MHSFNIFEAPRHADIRLEQLLDHRRKISCTVFGRGECITRMVGVIRLLLAGSLAWGSYQVKIFRTRQRDDFDA